MIKRRKAMRYYHIIYHMSYVELKYIVNLIKNQNKNIIMLDLGCNNKNLKITNGHSKILFSINSTFVLGGHIGGIQTYDPVSKNKNTKIIISPFTIFKMKKRNSLHKEYKERKFIIIKNKSNLNNLKILPY